MSQALGTDVFNLAPIAMWIEDFSEVNNLFNAWKAEGVTDIRSFLREETSRVVQCSRLIRIDEVNRKTLELFEADDIEHLRTNISRVFRDDMLEPHINELAELFDGKLSFSTPTVNYSLTGRRLDIQLRGAVMPGYEATLGKLLLTTEDITVQEDARRAEAAQRRYAEGIFQHSPVSLWIEDFSRIKQLIDNVRARGISDFRTFTDVHPEFVQQCISEIRVLSVNQATLDLFGAPDQTTLLMRLGDVLRDDMEKPFREQLNELWNGNLFHHREVINYALDGSERHILLHFSVFPGHEHDWSRVQVALADITARKKAEAYLEYLGKHDVLTKLYNRAFYVDEMNRLERKLLRPVSAIVVDLNGLKETNDQMGHDAGDALLRRFGEILNGAVSPPNHACRIGGDEFAVLMPGADAKAAASMMETINELLKINNQFYSTAQISMSLGAATSEPGESMESLLKRADVLMYEHKKAHYQVKHHGSAEHSGSF
ncbi:sensor domain-containing diguanylate cyclase [Neorhizobium lilium]|uniref:Sensor domain-containing diguanylate cyclase n=1 Tax=Neorhizobium lilium TaxID=2503024 RepID=A0A3S3RIP6_9HYPH|nr:sensor domain-containing diguanylate cyclase [Neorhizobium lilium]RWX79054.1 sensor domain-containing diguanylate cyclase [Neorhizobium lilium]